MKLTPRTPQKLNPLALKILQELSCYPAASGVVLGGGVALQHYCEYRETVDLDAWWGTDASSETENALQSAIEAVAKREGLDLSVRTWRETQSFELKQPDTGNAVFSFQIARRTIELEPPLESPWPPVKIEAFCDNLGAKMNAVVDRGAPRDLLDVFEVCHRGLATVKELWDLWQRKNATAPLAEARVRVLQHLEMLESRRPLESIEENSARASARVVRDWVRGILCSGG